MTQVGIGGTALGPHRAQPLFVGCVDVIDNIQHSRLAPHRLKALDIRAHLRVAYRRVRHQVYQVLLLRRVRERDVLAIVGR